MKKDTQNVIITFSLVLSAVFGSSYIYSENVSAAQVTEQALKRTQEEAAAQALLQEQLRAIVVENATTSVKEGEEQIIEIATQESTSRTIPTSVPKKSAADIALEQALLAEKKLQAEIQAKAQADLLAKQIAEAKAAADKLAADQAAADAAAKASVPASRKSRAS